MITIPLNKEAVIIITSRATLAGYTALEKRHREIVQRLCTKFIYFAADDPVVKVYEAIRSLLVDGVSRRKLATGLNISRDVFEKHVEAFTRRGLVSLFPRLAVNDRFDRKMEYQIVILKTGKPKMRTHDIQKVVKRLNDHLPVTDEDVSHVLSCHGLGQRQKEEDFDFEEWQRFLESLSALQEDPGCFVPHEQGFLITGDTLQSRMETLRQLSLLRDEGKIGQLAAGRRVSRVTLYTLAERFLKYGALGILDKAPGKSRGGVVSYAVESEIVLKKLASPDLSAQGIVDYLHERHKVDVTRGGVLKIFSAWQLAKAGKLLLHFEDAYDTKKPGKESLQIPATDRDERLPGSAKGEQPLNLTASHAESRFVHLVKELAARPLAICTPGPLLLADSVDRLGLYESFLALDTKTPKEQLFYIFLLNINRIIAGLPTISRLDYLVDRGVALASGLADTPADSTVHNYLNLVTPDLVQSLRRDTVVRARELDLIKGERAAFDFHMIEFFGEHPGDKGISFGPHPQSGAIVPGFRPHIYWDLDTNTVGGIVFGYGKGRGPTTIARFVKEQILSCFGQKALREAYMDSEYTGMDVMEFFVSIGCEVTMCLKRNKKIERYVEQVLKQDTWEIYHDYQISSLHINMDKSHKEVLFIVSRRIRDGRIRCFGTTKSELTPAEALDDYRSRWAIENGIKDLSYNYFIDQVPGIDPAKIDAHFFCVMYAKLTVDFFVKEIGGIVSDDHKNYKRTLDTLRDIYFCRKNCLLERRGETLILTFRDDIAPRYREPLESLWAKKRLNFIAGKIPWWGGLRLDIEFDPQLPSSSPSNKFEAVDIWDVISPLEP